jgi:pSer/pThr/pTyr-binding forkhead associated (FHA) protein
MGAIIVANGPRQGLFLPLGRKTSVIGRDEAACLQIEDEQVSRRHLQVRFDPAIDGYTAFDMKSSNGTLLNGRPLHGDTPLKDGDELTLGNSVVLLFSTNLPTDKLDALEVVAKAGERRRTTLVE